MSKCNDKHCKYNDEGCIFFAQGSGNPEDMPCAEALITKKRVLKLLEERFDIFPFTADIMDAIECMDADAVIDPNGISRKAAINALETTKRIASYELHGGEVLRTFNVVLNSLINIMSLLPPANNSEKPNSSDIIHCKDCKYFKQVFAPNDNDGLCGHWHSKCDARTNRNGYCSHAERREVTK